MDSKPIAYQTNKVRFYNRDFYVDERVHIPRKNTEPLITTALEILRPLPSQIIADIGTAAGVIAITLALELPQITKIYATEPNIETLEVAKKNISMLKVKNRVDTITGSLLEPVAAKKVTCIVANLPHASAKKIANLRPETKNFEPFTGYFGGETGLEWYAKMFEQFKTYAYRDDVHAILIKISPQHAALLPALQKEFLPNYNLHFVNDDEDKKRVAVFTRRV